MGIGWPRPSKNPEPKTPRDTLALRLPLCPTLFQLLPTPRQKQLVDNPHRFLKVVFAGHLAPLAGGLRVVGPLGPVEGGTECWRSLHLSHLAVRMALASSLWNRVHLVSCPLCEGLCQSTLHNMNDPSSPSGPTAGQRQL